MNKKISINAKRLKENILALSSIGKQDGGGIFRVAFSPADYQARVWLLEKFKKIDVEAFMDGAMNVIGRLKPNSGVTGPTLVVGSHIDTVPNAGALDGSLGVLLGLESLTCLRENNVTLKFPLEIVAFSDEEGRFGGMFGSRSYAGLMTPGYLEEARDLDGVRLKDAMQELGHDPYKALDAAHSAGQLKCFIEVHIEQGPILDEKKCPIGIVTEITGLFKWQVRLTGYSNHAGTTPMNMRQDAFMGLADFAHEIPRIIDENGTEFSKITIGKVQLLPGSANTIPGEARFSVDVRDTSEDVLRLLQDACRRTLSAIARRRKLMFEFKVLSWIAPVVCDRTLVDIFESTSSGGNIAYIKLPSGAVHDSQMISSIAPVGMFFVPSKGGISHSPHEWTDWRDIETGANVLLRSLLALNEIS